MVPIADIVAAQQRIAPYVRRTPMIPVMALKQSIPGGDRLWLKLECLQVTGSFKARGAVNTLKSLSPEALQTGIVTASGGNHGLAVAYAGWLAGVPTTIYLGRNTPTVKADKLRQWGATVVIEGAGWDEANQAARAIAAAKNLTYIHPFADPRVIAGQGSLGLEMLEDLPKVETLLVSIGGGGLISGVSLAAKARKSGVKIIGIEPEGAPTLKSCLEAKRVVELPTITTKANTLAPRRTEVINFDIIREYVDEIVLVSDEAMQEACRWLWFELGVAAELSGAAPIAALMTGAYKPATNEAICALICGVGAQGIKD